MALRLKSDCAYAFGTIPTYGDTLVAAAAGHVISVYRAVLSNGGANAAMYFQEADGTLLSQGFQVGANSTIILETDVNGDPLFQTRKSASFFLRLIGGATNITWMIWYKQVRAP